MMLFKVTRTDHIGYDEYSAVIVAAVSPAQARLVHPRTPFAPRGSGPWHGGACFAAAMQYKFVSPNGGLQPINPGLPLDQWPRGRWFEWRTPPMPRPTPWTWDDDKAWHVDEFHGWTTDLASLEVEQIGVEHTPEWRGEREDAYIILASFNAG